MKTFLVAMLFCLAFLPRTVAADDQVIHEARALRDSLSTKDPLRFALNLRLANLLYNECLKIESGPRSSAQSKTRLENYRAEAIALYQSALAGNGRRSSAPTGKEKTKVAFQLAKLLADTGDIQKSDQVWEELLQQSDSVEVRREAALRLARVFENRKTVSDQKKAETYFQIVLELGSGTELEPFACYHLAWVLKNEGKLREAIEKMNQAIGSSKGEMREEVLRDLISFYASDDNHSAEDMASVETIGSRLSRPKLLLDLADAYFLAGKRKAGVLALGSYDRSFPSAKEEVRLLEEYYGERLWDSYRETSSLLLKGKQALETEEAAQAEKTLRRLLVQLDAERLTAPEHLVDFQNTVDLYLKIFPKSTARFTIAQSWIASEKRPSQKSRKIGDWLSNSSLVWTPEEIQALSATRALIALDVKDYATLVEEMDRSLSTNPKGKAKREDERLLAGALFDLKHYDRAIPLLHSLAYNPPLDEISARSELLTLQILAEWKKYPEMVNERATWLQSTAANVRLPADSKSMKEIHELGLQAEFEEAVALGQGQDNEKSRKALGTFRRFCTSGRLRPKSCENARVLALRMHDEDSLISILIAEGKEKDLAAEYEAAGYFVRAARLYEKQLTPEAKDYLRVATLFALGGQASERDRVLKNLLGQFRRGKSLTQNEEENLAVMLSESGVVSSGALRFPWKENQLCFLANELVTRMPESKESRRVLLGCSRFSGKAWSELVVNSLQEQYRRQAAIAIYGKASRAKFEKRLEAIRALTGIVERYFNGADSKTRIEIASIAAKAFRGFGDEITNSPVSDTSLTPDERAKLEASLAQMASPFLDKATAYEQLVSDEQKKVSNLASERVAPEPFGERMSGPPDLALKSLHEDPFSEPALQSLKKYYTSSNQLILASYFEGRIKQLEESRQQ